MFRGISMYGMMVFELVVPSTDTATYNNSKQTTNTITKACSLISMCYVLYLACYLVVSLHNY